MRSYEISRDLVRTFALCRLMGLTPPSIAQKMISLELPPDGKITGKAYELTPKLLTYNIHLRNFQLTNIHSSSTPCPRRYWGQYRHFRSLGLIDHHPLSNPLRSSSPQPLASRRHIHVLLQEHVPGEFPFQKNPADFSVKILCVLLM
jgi:hypothetical protein